MESSVTDDRPIWNSASFMFTIPSKKGIEYIHQINTRSSMLLSICNNISLLKLLLFISIP